jgi:amino-acid N-acetyltransferase
MQDFIISLLSASPSLRDSRSYLASFGSPPPPKSSISPSTRHPLTASPPKPPIPSPSSTLSSRGSTSTNALVTSFLHPAQPRTALVKIQGPFTDRQLESVCRGMIYLQKLGLVSVIVVDRDDWHERHPMALELEAEEISEEGKGKERDGEREKKKVLTQVEKRAEAMRETDRIVQTLTRLGSTARPITQTLVHITDNPSPTSSSSSESSSSHYSVARADLASIERSVRDGEIPVLPPVALDLRNGALKTIRADANEVVRALVKGMVEVGKITKGESFKLSVEAEAEIFQVDGTTSPLLPSSLADNAASSNPPPAEQPLDLTPYRLMIINREGGIPSYARSGLPHLTINLSSELPHIHSTFLPTWHLTHPTSLPNLALANHTLSLMPPASSALIVSHRSPRALIANLITNKPAHSPSLPHALLDSVEGRLTRDTPTLIRRGVGLRIERELGEVDLEKLTGLLEGSFRRKVDREGYYGRLKERLEFVIIAGDYLGAVIVTSEPFADPDCSSDSALLTSTSSSPSSSSSSSSTSSSSSSSAPRTFSYLDKFAVSPLAQNTGTSDFLWSALRDETFGSSLPSALNSVPGSLVGNHVLNPGRDLVWRSRSDNGVNKWYFERSSGFWTTGEGGKWKLFWCDREKGDGGSGGGGGKVDGKEGGEVEGEAEERIGGEVGRLEMWSKVVEGIPSAWSD